MISTLKTLAEIGPWAVYEDEKHGKEFPRLYHSRTLTLLITTQEELEQLHALLEAYFRETQTGEQ